MIVDRHYDKARALGDASGTPALELPADPQLLPRADILLLAIPNGARPPYFQLVRTGQFAAAYV